MESLRPIFSRRGGAWHGKAGPGKAGQGTNEANILQAGRGGARLGVATQGKEPMNKYKAKRTVVDGISFASKAEARRYTQLLLLQRAGAIEELELQPRLLLVVAKIKIGTYVGDFRYRDMVTGDMILEDVKGVLTPVYRIKKRLVKALHGIDILETSA